MNEHIKKDRLSYTIKKMISMRFKIHQHHDVKCDKNTKNNTIKNMFKGKQQSSTIKESLKQNQEDILIDYDSISLKFIVKISDYDFLIGNRNQLNLINISQIKDQIVHTLWSISEGQEITNIYVKAKIKRLFIVCNKKLHIYSVTPQKINEKPKKIKTFVFSFDIKEIKFVQTTILLIFLEQSLISFQAESDFQKLQYKKVKEYRYTKPNAMKEKKFQFFCLPQQQKSIFYIFFKAKTKPDIYQIYSLKIEFITSKTITFEIFNPFFQVPERYIDNCKIIWYNSNIFLIHIGHEIYSIRNGYFLDNIITTQRSTNRYLYLLSNKQFLFFHKNRFDIYSFYLDQNQSPEKFRVACTDSIPIKQPQNSQFFDIISIFDEFLLIFQQTTITNAKQQLYWLSITESIPKQQKLNLIYSLSKQQLEQASMQTLLQKVQIALKIGYEEDQAFYHLWLRSNKNSIKDYQLLLMTKNYAIIIEQIRNKLIKKTMKFWQIEKIISESESILKKKVESSQCNLKDIQHYSYCHFLLCKLKMMKIVKTIEVKGKKQISLNIQEYDYIKNIELNKELMQLLSFLLTKKYFQQTRIRIRALLTQFSLIYHMNYQLILQKIIKKFNIQFISLLKALPELLPGHSNLQSESSLRNWIKNSQDKQWLNGVWQQHDLTSTRQFLILQNIKNFENREFIEEFTASNEYKIYKWNNHGAIYQSKQTIKKIINQNTPQFIFTLLYVTLYKYQSMFKPKEFKNLITFIQDNYNQIPNNLKGKFQFYSNLYDHFKNINNAINIVDFFSKTEEDLFLLYFKRQNDSRRIFILKQIKPLYQKFLTNGLEHFLTNFLKYFQKPTSKWSELKSVLNKFNSQGQDFHKLNTEAFETIIDSLMQKLYLGNQNTHQKINLDQVLPYIQNIYFPIENERLFQKLVFLLQLQEEKDILNELRMSMSIKQIYERGQQVIYKLIQNQIQLYQIKEIKDFHKLKLFASTILSQINYIQAKLYIDKYQQFAYKSLLLILLQDEKMIPLCKQLLNDEQFSQQFIMTQVMLQNIVIYLYRKKFSKNCIYEQSKGYIVSIIELLDQISLKRTFLQYSDIYATIFTHKNFKICYPLFSGYYPRIHEVEKVINCLNKQEIMSINFEEVYTLIMELKSLGEQNNIRDSIRFSSSRFNEGYLQMQHELYSIFFLKYVHLGLIKEKALQVLQTMLDIMTKSNKMNIVYLIMLIQVICKEMIIELRPLLIKCISYYFDYQKDLFKFIKELFLQTSGLTNNQLKGLFQDKIKEKSKQIIFNPNNLLFSSLFKNQILKECNLQKHSIYLNGLFQSIWVRIAITREEFIKHNVYETFYRLLLHEPLYLPEYIFRKKNCVNVQSLRALITLIGAECVFDMEKVLVFGQSFFSILLCELTDISHQKVVNATSLEFKYPHNLQYTDEYMKQLIRYSANDLIGNSILNFRNKIDMFKKIDKDIYEDQKIQSLNILLQDKKKFIQRGLVYPFNDHDKNYSSNRQNLDVPFRMQVNKPFQFDDVASRSQKREHFNYFMKTNFQYNQTRTLKFNYDQELQNNLKSKNANLKFVHKTSSIQFQTQKLIENQESQTILSPLKLKSRRKTISYSNQLQHQIQPPSNKKSSNFEIEQQSSYCSEIINDKMTDFKQNNDLCQFNASISPQDNIILNDSKINSFKSFIYKTYRNLNVPFIDRIKSIWQTKKNIFGQNSIDPYIFEITIRLGEQKCIRNLWVSIQDIFSDVIFIEQLTKQALIRLLQQNIEEFVTNEDDILKIAQLMGQVFHSEPVRQSILWIFIMKTCKLYLLSDNNWEKNNLKNICYQIQENMNDKYLTTQICNLRKNSYDYQTKKIILTLVYFKKHGKDFSEAHFQEYLQNS